VKKLLYLSLATCLFEINACKVNRHSPVNPPQYKTLDGQAPVVIAHRGAPGLLPEHTLESYQRAIDDGADFIEQDLVLTKDQVLVCRHEPMLSGTTNVADLPQFASRKTTKTVDGVARNDWFVSDFTLAELKTIKAKQALADRPQQFNGLYDIPTFQEVIDLAKAQTLAKGRTIGIYPETKHPTFHEALGLPLTSKLLEALRAAGWNNRDAPVFVQSFEVANLRAIRDQYRSTVKTVQLLDATDVDATGTLVLAAPSAQPYDFVVAGDQRTYLDLTTDAGLDFRENLRHRHRALETLRSAVHAHGQAAGHFPHRAGPPARAARARVHVPQRAPVLAARLPEQPRRRIPEFLRARPGRRVLRPHRHGGRRQTTGKVG
jgi:glycerophosphoryl diester phosphodiesterase